MPAIIANPLSGDRDTDGVLSGIRWAVPSLTYSFPASASYYGTRYGSEPLTHFQPLNAAQTVAARAVLRMYSAVVNLTFTEVTESATVHGDLRFAQSDEPDTAWAYYPASSSYGGDSWYNGSSGWYGAPAKGNYAYATFIHETGHALGLKHGHEDRAMTPEHDSMEYTVMTYRSYVGQSVEGGYTNGSWSYAQTPMMYDIAALQHMYGANFATNSGANTYRWNEATGELSIDGVAQGAAGANRVFMTLWDGGGADTYDFSNYSGGVTADLRPGAWTTTSAAQLAYLGDGHYAVGNLANALLYHGDTRSLIENAVGGAGSDRLTGNDIANRLAGNGGADTLVGLGGDDVLYAGAGADTLEGSLGSDFLFGGAGVDVARYAGARDSYSVVSTRLGTHVSGAGGTDTLHGVERLSFDDVLVRTARAGSDYDADGSTDLFWRHTDGTTYVWQFGESGVTGRNYVRVDPSSKVIAVDTEYNGDGIADVLWSSADGTLYAWQMSDTGGMSSRTLGKVDAAWRIADGGADRNGDGISDLLLRDGGGAVYMWQGAADSGFIARTTSDVSTSWHVAESRADFNGDGSADVLWRNDSGGVYFWQVGPSWTITGRDLVDMPGDWRLIDGSSDRNGDGTSDLVWRTSAGAIVLWEMHAAAGYRQTALGSVSAEWQVVDAHGDYNADGKADLLWRHTDGTLFTWQMDGTKVSGRDLTAVNPLWSFIDSSADRNADGASDVLWQLPGGSTHVWYAAAAGGYADQALGSVNPDWHVIL